MNSFMAMLSYTLAAMAGVLFISGVAVLNGKGGK